MHEPPFSPTAAPYPGNIKPGTTPETRLIALGDGRWKRGGGGEVKELLSGGGGEGLNEKDKEKIERHTTTHTTVRGSARIT